MATEKTALHCHHLPPFAFSCALLHSLPPLGFQFPTLGSGGWKLATGSSALLSFTAGGRRTFLNACAAIAPESRTRAAVPYQHLKQRTNHGWQGRLA